MSAPPEPQSTRTLRQRVVFVARAGVIAAILLALIVPTALGAGFVAVLTAPVCGGETVPPMPYESVNFSSSEFGREPPAYFIAAEQPNAESAGATVIVVPTGNAGRGDRMAEIGVYHEAGFAVLSYSARACVGGAANSLGYKEAAQVGDALAYLVTRSDVDMNRIGIHGFSAGGATAILAAAQFSAIRAVVAEGGYHDFSAEVEQNTPTTLWFAPLFRFGARLSYRVTTGDDMSVLSPIRAIGRIAPRPILLIYGTNEPGLAGARLQQAAAGSSAELWEVAGAGHGNYLDIAGDEYTEKRSSSL
ncbi:MAG: prolyl oligopeptidase family serine peptidase [Anaerolineae bacterium]